MRRFALSLFVSLLAVRAFADDAASLIARIRASNAMIDDLRELTDTVGGRVTGSPNEKKAAQWAAAKLKAAGVDDVRIESYPLPVYWESVSATASCIEPAEFPLRIAAAPMTESTPDSVEGELVDFGDGSAEALKKVPRAAGKIAFVRTGIMGSLDDLFADYLRITALLDAAKASGVSAMLIESSQRRSLLYRHPMSLDGSMVKLPTAIVAHDQAERLARLMDRGPVRVRMKLVNRVTKNTQAANVVGEIRGSDKANEIVLFGAHLDSWDMGTGALDNGVNSASVIDVARAIKQLGIKPRRTMRFALFTGEEQGMIGSRAYVAAHAGEMPRTVMMLTADIGSGRTAGFFLDGREDIRGGVEQALMPFYPDAKTQQNVIDAIDGTDNFDFILAGVANLVANQDPAPYLPDYHAESDTFDKVDVSQAKENEAIDASVLWRFANSDARPPQQTRAEVEKLLADRALVDQMKLFAQWDDWAAGRRGLPK